MRMRFVLGASAVLIGLGTIVACQSTEDGSHAGVRSPGAPPFGGSTDMAMAANLWSDMRGYTSWASYPGLEGWQDGVAPHGKALKYFINATAARNPRNPGNGSIIVKENYMGRGAGPPAAVTVMKKIAGYDPETADWFWVKFAADGSVMKNDKGMSLAGRVAKGMPKGCIACHGNAGGNDYLFINDD